jgi:hypothetical protein
MNGVKLQLVWTRSFSRVHRSKKIAANKNLELEQPEIGENNDMI